MVALFPPFCTTNSFAISLNETNVSVLKARLSAIKLAK